MRTKAILFLCLVSLLWGSGWIFGPELAGVAQPFAASALAMALGALLLGLTAAGSALTRRDHLPHLPVLRPSLVLALVMLAAPALFLLFADAHGIGGWPLLLYGLLPLLTAFPGDRWSLLITPMALAAGAVFVLVDRTIVVTPRTCAWALPALLAIGLQAYGLRYAASRLRGAGWVQITASTAIQAALAALLLALGSLAFDPGPRIAPWSQWNSTAVLSLLYLGMAAAVPYVVLYRLLACGPLLPEQVAAGQWLQTLFAVAESAFFARARIPWLDWLAGAVLLVCLVRVVAPQTAEDSTSIARSNTAREKDLL